MLSSGGSGEVGEDFRHGSLGREVVEVAEDFGFSVLDELIRPADAFDGCGEAVGVEVFDHSAAEAIVEDVVFKGANHLAAAGAVFEHSSVQRLDEARIDEGHRKSEGFEAGFDVLGHGKHRAEADERDVAALGEDFRLADFEKFPVGRNRRSADGAARVADGGGTGIVGGHRVKHVGEFILVLGLHLDEVRDVAEEADVEQPMMGRAVIAGETAAVHAQPHREVLQRDVV